MCSEHYLLLVPDLEAPEPPPEQVALRERLERLLSQYLHVAVYRHEDEFHESESGATTYGWGTEVRPVASGKPFTVWFDGLDHDIAIWTERTGWRLRDRARWFEWLDLTDIDAVLLGVEERARTLLRDYR